MSVQLEEICKYSRSPLNENDVCFCHDLVGGKCLLPQNRTYTDSPRLQTPPKVWFSKPDCCQSCTVPCCVKADSSSTNLLNNPEKLRPLTDEELLQVCFLIIIHFNRHRVINWKTVTTINYYV